MEFGYCSSKQSSETKSEPNLLPSLISGSNEKTRRRIKYTRSPRHCGVKKDSPHTLIFFIIGLVFVLFLSFNSVSTPPLFSLTSSVSPSSFLSSIEKYLCSSEQEAVSSSHERSCSSTIANRLAHFLPLSLSQAVENHSAAAANNTSETPLPGQISFLSTYIERRRTRKTCRRQTRYCTVVCPRLFLFKQVKEWLNNIPVALIAFLRRLLATSYSGGLFAEAIEYVHGEGCPSVIRKLRSRQWLTSGGSFEADGCYLVNFFLNINITMACSDLKYNVTNDHGQVSEICSFNFRNSVFFQSQITFGFGFRSAELKVRQRVRVSFENCTFLSLIDPGTLNATGVPRYNFLYDYLKDTRTSVLFLRDPSLPTSLDIKQPYLQFYSFNVSIMNNTFDTFRKNTGPADSLDFSDESSSAVAFCLRTYINSYPSSFSFLVDFPNATIVIANNSFIMTSEHESGVFAPVVFISMHPTNGVITVSDNTFALHARVHNLTKDNRTVANAFVSFSSHFLNSMNFSRTTVRIERNNGTLSVNSTDTRLAYNSIAVHRRIISSLVHLRGGVEACPAPNNSFYTRANRLSVTTDRKLIFVNTVRSGNNPSALVGDIAGAIFFSERWGPGKGEMAAVNSGGPTYSLDVRISGNWLNSTYNALIFEDAFVASVIAGFDGQAFVRFVNTALEVSDNQWYHSSRFAVDTTVDRRGQAYKFLPSFRASVLALSRLWLFVDSSINVSNNHCRSSSLSAKTMPNLDGSGPNQKDGIGFFIFGVLQEAPRTEWNRSTILVEKNSMIVSCEVGIGDQNNAVGFYFGASIAQLVGFYECTYVDSGRVDCSYPDSPRLAQGGITVQNNQLTASATLQTVMRPASNRCLLVVGVAVFPYAPRLALLDNSLVFNLKHIEANSVFFLVPSISVAHFAASSGGTEDKLSRWEINRNSVISTVSSPSIAGATSPWLVSHLRLLRSLRSVGSPNRVFLLILSGNAVSARWDVHFALAGLIMGERHNVLTGINLSYAIFRIGCEVPDSWRSTQDDGPIVMLEDKNPWRQSCGNTLSFSGPTTELSPSTFFEISSTVLRLHANVSLTIAGNTVRLSSNASTPRGGSTVKGAIAYNPLVNIPIEAIPSDSGFLLAIIFNSVFFNVSYALAVTLNSGEAAEVRAPIIDLSRSIVSPSASLTRTRPVLVLVSDNDFIYGEKVWSRLLSVDGSQLPLALVGVWLPSDSNYLIQDSVRWEYTRNNVTIDCNLSSLSTRAKQFLLRTMYTHGSLDIADSDLLVEQCRNFLHTKDTTAVTPLSSTFEDKSISGVLFLESLVCPVIDRPPPIEDDDLKDRTPSSTISYFTQTGSSSNFTHVGTHSTSITSSQSTPAESGGSRSVSRSSVNLTSTVSSAQQATASRPSTETISKQTTLSNTRKAELSLSRTLPLYSLTWSLDSLSESLSNANVSRSLSDSANTVTYSALDGGDASYTLTIEIRNEPTRDPAVVARETVQIVAGALASSVGIASVSVGGSLGVANAFSRLANCDDEADDELPIMVHPLRFTFGPSVTSTVSAATLSNCLLIPFIIIGGARLPVAYLVRRYLSRPGTTEAEVLAALGWPSLLVLPFVPLGEGIGVVVTRALRYGQPLGIVCGLIGVAVVSGVLVAWVHTMVRVAPRSRLLHTRTKHSRALWFINPLYEWEPLPAKHHQPEKNQLKGSCEEGAKEKGRDKNENSAEASEGLVHWGSSDPLLTANGVVHHVDEEAREGGGCRTEEKTVTEPFDTEAARREYQQMEIALLRSAHMLGEKRFYYAELLSFVCSLIVGVAEGMPGSACKVRVLIAFAAAATQSLSNATSIVPLELFLQSCLGLCVTVLAGVAVAQVFNGSDASTGGLMETINAVSNVLGLSATLFGMGRAAVDAYSSTSRKARARRVMMELHAAAEAVEIAIMAERRRDAGYIDFDDGGMMVAEDAVAANQQQPRHQEEGQSQPLLLLLSSSPTLSLSSSFSLCSSSSSLKLGEVEKDTKKDGEDEEELELLIDPTSQAKKQSPLLATGNERRVQRRGMTVRTTNLSEAKSPADEQKLGGLARRPRSRSRKFTKSCRVWLSAEESDDDGAEEGGMTDNTTLVGRARSKSLLKGIALYGLVEDSASDEDFLGILPTTTLKQRLRGGSRKKTSKEGDAPPRNLLLVAEVAAIATPTSLAKVKSVTTATQPREQQKGADVKKASSANIHVVGDTNECIL